MTRVSKYVLFVVKVQQGFVWVTSVLALGLLRLARRCTSLVDQTAVLAERIKGVDLHRLNCITKYIK